MMCTFCKKKGHTEPFCFAKKCKEREASDTKTNDPGEMFLVATNLEEKNTPIDPSIWIADSGATLHASNSLVGMFDLENCQVCITVGNGKQVTSLKKGKKKITINQKHGQDKIVTLSHVHYVPELICNLFSVTSAISNGGIITSDGLMLTVMKGNQQITFNHQIWTNQGYLLGIKTKHFQGEVTMPITVKGMKIMKKVDINDLNIILCHANERYVRSTAKKYDWEFTGTWKVCEYCALGKARQKNLYKINTNPINYKDKESQFYLDISSINSTSLGGSKYWCLVVDEQTKMKWSFFLKEKSEQTSKLFPFLKDLKTCHKKNVQFICCNNSGENRTLHLACQQSGIQANFEFTPPGMQQHNGVVEQAFATLYGRVRAMMNTAGLTLSM